MMMNLLLNKNQLHRMNNQQIMQENRQILQELNRRQNEAAKKELEVLHQVFKRSTSPLGC